VAEREFFIQQSGARVSLLSREVGNPSDDRVLGSLHERFRVIFEVAAVLRASGIPPSRWVMVVGEAIDRARASGGDETDGGAPLEHQRQTGVDRPTDLVVRSGPQTGEPRSAVNADGALSPGEVTSR
jgi:hypothetical protein